MEKWTADFVNNPGNGYELIVEILHDDHDVAIIKKENKELKIVWYAHTKELNVPFNWLLELMDEAKKTLTSD
jgi:hypothetical protein